MSDSAAVVAPGVTAARWRSKRWFYVSMALFMILLSVAGFGPSIIDQSKRNAPPTALVMAHGIVAMAWFSCS